MTKQQASGGLTPDMFAVETVPVIFAITESPVEKGLIWVGTNDGLVQVTRDGGAHWTNVTRNIPNLPPLGDRQQHRAVASCRRHGVRHD